jgi:GT2 family glycosyltransferase
MDTRGGRLLARTSLGAVQGHADRPTIDVVIPVYGEVSDLRRCLHSILRQTFRPAKILLVDNGPERATEHQSRLYLGRAYSGVVYLHQPIPGSYAARNLGLASSHADYVAFTDADCIADRRWLEAAVKYFRAHPEARIAGGAIRIFPERAVPGWAEAYDMATSFNVSNLIERHGFCPTANLVVRRDVFGELGVFRQDLFSGGDKEWGLRARAAGIPTHFVREQLVFHPARTSFSSICRQRARFDDGSRQLRGEQGPSVQGVRRGARRMVPPLRGVAAFLGGSKAPAFPPLWRARIAAVYLAVHYYRTARAVYRALGFGLDIRQ